MSAPAVRPQTGPCEHLHRSWCPQCPGGVPVPAGPSPERLGLELGPIVRELIRRLATGTHTARDLQVAELILASAQPAAEPEEGTP